jgi:hypothetical protein
VQAVPTPWHSVAETACLFVAPLAHLSPREVQRNHHEPGMLLRRSRKAKWYRRYDGSRCPRKRLAALHVSS